MLLLVCGMKPSSWWSSPLFTWHVEGQGEYVSASKVGCGVMLGAYRTIHAAAVALFLDGSFCVGLDATRPACALRRRCAERIDRGLGSAAGRGTHSGEPRCGR